MFRITTKIVSTALAAAVVAVPIASGKSPSGMRFTTDTLGGKGYPAARGYQFITDTLGGNGYPAAANSSRIITDTLGGNGVRRATPQGALDAVKRSSPNQAGLAWQYLRDSGQITPSTPQTTLDAVKRTSPTQVGLAWQYLRDTGQITTPTTPSTQPRPDDHLAARGIDPGATVTVSSPTRFDWSDAGTGAASAAGLMMLLGGAALIQLRSRRRTRTTA